MSRLFFAVKVPSSWIYTFPEDGTTAYQLFNDQNNRARSPREQSIWTEYDDSVGFLSIGTLSLNILGPIMNRALKYVPNFL